MAALTTALLAIGTAVSVGGAYVQQQGQEKAIEAQESQDKVRQQQMEFDAARRRREIMRQSTLARATALATTTNQGAANPGGSGLPGAQAQQSNWGYSGVQGVNVAESQGNSMFAYQAQANAGYRQAAMGGTIGSIGGGLSSLGGALQATGKTFNQVGPTATSQSPLTITDQGAPYQW